MLTDTLLDLAIERIRQYLPEYHEIDDISWGENIFQICVFDAEHFPGRMVDWFRFEIHTGDTEDETNDRFNNAVEKFIESWR